MKHTEQTTDIFKLGMDVLYLANCALQDAQPQTDIVKAMDLSKVYAMAKKQSMTAITWFALEKWLNGGEERASGMDAQLLAKWQQARDMAIRKNTMLDIAREQIFTWFEAQGIWYMPLKGTILKEMYPKLGMRQMADNDILIDAAYRRQVYDYIVSLGYEGKGDEHGVHDKFLKQPFYNFEIHNKLVSSKMVPEVRDYYDSIKDKLICSEGCRYDFRDEDFYIYLMVHAYKHHSTAGNGVRHIMDIHVFLDKKPDLDWEYVNRELEQLGILDYASTVKSLAQKLFSGAAGLPRETEQTLQPHEREFLSVCIGAGAYGTYEIRTEKAMEKFAQGKKVTFFTKLRYFWNRLFWEAGLRSDFPKLAKCKLLHPFLYIARAVKILFQRRKALRGEIKGAKKK